MLIKDLLNSNRNKIAIIFFFLFLFSVIIFSYTIKIRAQYYDELSDGHHQWLTGSTVKFAKNWYKEGPFNIKFAMLENPASIEFPTIQSRGVYSSYPPGTVLPIYLISKILRHEPSIEIVYSYNLLNHFLIAFFLSLTIFFFLVLYIQCSYTSAILLSLIPILIELLTPAPLYWHQNVFFADQAVILPYIIFIFLEVIRRKTKYQWRIQFLQSLFMFYGILTDWLFVFVLLVVYIKRLINREIKLSLKQFVVSSLIYWLPFITVVIIYLTQVYSLGAIKKLVPIILDRTLKTNESYDGNFFEPFWLWHIREGYGTISILYFFGSLFILSFSMLIAFFKNKIFLENKEKIKEIESLIWMLLIPSFLQVNFFRNHSVEHDFSALKFSIPLATVPFVLIPLLIGLYFKINVDDIKIISNSTYIEYKHNTIKRINIAISIIPFFLLLFTLSYVMVVHPYWRRFFPVPNYEFRVKGDFIKDNTNYRDILFSPDFEIPSNPPQQLSYSMKRVYKISSIYEIYDRVKAINKVFVINILLRNKDKIKIDDLYKLRETAYEVKALDDMCLYKVTKEKFYEYYNQLNNTSN